MAGVMALGIVTALLSSCEDLVTEQGSYTCDSYALDDGISNWLADVRPLIVAYCAECHRPERASGGIILSDYNITADLAHSGRLLGVIRHEPGYKPMPYLNPKLDSCSISVFELWVEQGALNN